MTIEPFARKGDYLLTREPKDYRTRAEEGKWTLVGVISQDLPRAYTGSDRFEMHLLEERLPNTWPSRIELETPEDKQLRTVFIEHIPSVVCEGIPRMHSVYMSADVNLYELRKLLTHNRILGSEVDILVQQMVEHVKEASNTALDNSRYLYGLMYSLKKLPEEERRGICYFLENVLTEINPNYSYLRTR